MPVGPVRATVRVIGDPGAIDMTVQPGLPVEALRLPAGDYLVIADDTHRAVSTVDGELLLAADGDRLLVRSMDGDVVDVAGGDVRLHCGQADVTGVERPERIDASAFSWEPGEPVRPVRPVDEARARAIVDAELDRIAVQEPSPAPTGHRVLPVAVTRWTMMDMHGPDCDLGDTVDLFLWFREIGDEGNEGDALPDDMVVTVDAYAEEAVPGSVVDPSTMRWQTILRGDGWSARWDAPRPVLECVRLTGRFHRESVGAHETPLTPTRGRVTRLRYVSDDRTVDVAQMRRQVPEVWVHHTCQTGVDTVLVTLDLDAAERPAPGQLERPTAFQGFAVTTVDGERLLWRGDLRLPIVWRTNLSTGESTAVALPIAIGAAEMYLVRVLGRAGDGCRVNAVGRRFTVRADGTFSEETGDDDGRGVPLPSGGWVVTRCDRVEGWFPPLGTAMYSVPVDSGVFHLGHAGEDGAVTWVSETEVGEGEPWPTVLSPGGVLMLQQGRTVRYLDGDLQVVRERRVEVAEGHRLHTVSTSGDWLVVTSSDGKGDGELGILDPVTLDRRLTIDDVGSHRRVQVDDVSTVWFADGSTLRLFTRGDDGGWTSEEVG